MLAYTLGLDVAKATFDGALLPMTLPMTRRQERPKPYHGDNTAAGITALLTWLPVDPTTVHVCLEATSTYGLALARALHGAGCTVSVVNPLAVKRFAQSELQHSKTDRSDAGVLARYCRSQRPSPWTPPTAAQQALQGLVRRLADLQAQRGQEHNRLQVPDLPAVVQASLVRLGAALDAEITAVEQALDDLVADDAALTEAVTLLTSIPGVGQATAVRVLGELGDFHRFASAREVAAYAGLIPCHCDSGTSVHKKPRLAKAGAVRLRTLLFYPALAALRYNPLLKTFAERLRARGKPKMAVVGAVMHKLLRIIFGVLRSQTPFTCAMTS